MDVFWHKVNKSIGVKIIQAESEKREESEEWEELWVGHGHYGEQSDAKWGWTSQQQPVPPYYPRAPPPVPSPHLPTTAATAAPLLCGGHATSRTTKTPLLPLHGWMVRGTDRGGGGALFMWRVLQSVRIFYGCTVLLRQTSAGVCHQTVLVILRNIPKLCGNGNVRTHLLH